MFQDKTQGKNNVACFSLVYWRTTRNIFEHFLITLQSSGLKYWKEGISASEAQTHRTLTMSLITFSLLV